MSHRDSGIASGAGDRAGRVVEGGGGLRASLPAAAGRRDRGVHVHRRLLPGILVPPVTLFVLGPRHVAVLDLLLPLLIVALLIIEARLRGRRVVSDSSPVPVPVAVLAILVPVGTPVGARPVRGSLDRARGRPVRDAVSRVPREPREPLAFPPLAVRQVRGHIRKLLRRRALRVRVRVRVDGVPPPAAAG